MAGEVESQKKNWIIEKIFPIWTILGLFLPELA